MKTAPHIYKYAEREYGVTVLDLVRFEKRVLRQISQKRKGRQFVSFSGDIEKLVSGNQESRAV